MFSQTIFKSRLMLKSTQYRIKHTQAWKTQISPIFKRLLCYGGRTIFANLFILRQYSQSVVRHWCERYTISKTAEPVFSVGRLLLGACLISFAQDTITDDEMVESLKGFHVGCQPTLPACTSPVYFNQPTTSSGSSKLLPETKHLSTLDSDRSTSMPDSSSLATSSETSLLLTNEETSNTTTDPPLTLLVRNWRLGLMQRLKMSSDKVKEKDELNNASLSDFSTLKQFEIPPGIDLTDMVNCLFGFSPSKSIKSDLKGNSKINEYEPFVDASWESVVQNRHVRFWQKPTNRVDPHTSSGLVVVDSKFDQNDEMEVTLQDDTSSDDLERRLSSRKAAYEYRVCGTFDDISPLYFLEVQLNLAYRRQWDKESISHLDFIQPFTPDNASRVQKLADGVVSSVSAATKSNTLDSSAVDAATKQTEIVRWVVRYPWYLLLQDREYVYARRCWLDDKLLQTTGQDNAALEEGHGTEQATSIDKPRLNTDSSEGGVALFVSRATRLDKRDRMTLSVYDRRPVVHVDEYASDMVIKAHGRFDQKGLTYFLTYYDDQQINAPEAWINGVAKLHFPHFITKLHDAALYLEKYGLPRDIEPVVLQRWPSTADTAQENRLTANDRLPPPEKIEQTYLAHQMDRHQSQAASDIVLRERFKENMVFVQQESATTSANELLPRFFADIAPTGGTKCSSALENKDNATRQIDNARSLNWGTEVAGESRDCKDISSRDEQVGKEKLACQFFTDTHSKLHAVTGAQDAVYTLSGGQQNDQSLSSSRRHLQASLPIKKMTNEFPFKAANAKETAEIKNNIVFTSDIAYEDSLLYYDW